MRKEVKNMKKSIVTFAILGVLFGLPLNIVHAQTIQTPNIYNHHADRRADYGPVLLPLSQITGSSQSSLIVMVNGNTYTVNTTANTIFFRRYFGRSMISQFSIGDNVYIRGKWLDFEKTTINADFVRDVSIQEKNDTFIGTLTTMTSNGFVFQSKDLGSLTIVLSSSTKLLDRNGMVITISSMQNGDSLTLDGLYDRTSKIVTATTIKDYSLPR